jgi:hypothetical protein
MTGNNHALRAIHRHACTAVIRADRRLTPDDEAFWPLYLQAAMTAAAALIVDEIERIARTREHA